MSSFYGDNTNDNSGMVRKIDSTVLQCHVWHYTCIEARACTCTCTLTAGWYLVRGRQGGCFLSVMVIDFAICTLHILSMHTHTHTHAHTHTHIRSLPPGYSYACADGGGDTRRDDQWKPPTLYPLAVYRRGTAPHSGCNITLLRKSFAELSFLYWYYQGFPLYTH